MAPSLKLGVLALAAVLSVAGAAQAGIVDGSLTTSIPNSGDSYAWANVGSDGNGVVTLTAPSDVASSYDISGMLDGFDPNLSVIQTITNTTSLPWDSYTVTINPGPGYTVSNVIAYIAPIAGDNYFHNVQGVGPLTVAGTAVPGNSFTLDTGLVAPGQTLQTYFSFDITESSGQFGYTVLNAPHSTPEPASLAVLGIGAIALLRRRR